MGELEKRDYYGDLQLPFGASEAIVRQRFKRLARKFHPDVNAEPGAVEQFRRVREAYEVLTDPARRHLVDAWYAVTQRGVRRRYRIDAEPTVQTSAPRVRRVQRCESDRGWSFGCFGLAAFVLALLSLLTQVDSPSGPDFLVAVAVGLVVGSLAAIGGTRVREWLLWILYLWWP